jgi:hypothetical protein
MIDIFPGDVIQTWILFLERNVFKPLILLEPNLNTIVKIKSGEFKKMVFDLHKA